MQQIDATLLGERLKAARTALAIGQDKFLKMFEFDEDLNQSGLSAIELGRPSANLEKAKALAERAGVEIPYIENSIIKEHFGEAPEEPDEEQQETREVLATERSQDVVTVEEVRPARRVPMHKGEHLDPVTSALVSCCMLLQHLGKTDQEWVMGCLSGRFSRKERTAD